MFTSVIWTKLIGAVVGLSGIKTFRPEQNGWHFSDDILKFNTSNEDYCVLLQISLKYDPEGVADYM